MSFQQIQDNFASLVSPDGPLKGALPTKISGRDFVSDVLGMHSREEFVDSSQ